MFYGWYKGFPRLLLSLYDVHITCWLQNLKISLPRWDSPIWNTFFNMTFANRLEFLNGSKILNNTFFLVSLPLEKELSPSGLECHYWPSSYHLAASLWGGGRRQRGSWGLAFLLTSQMTWGYKTQYHSFRLGSWKQRAPWDHHMCPEFPSFILSPISSVAAYTSAQVHGKWSVSVNDFFIYVRERPIRQIQWDKFRDFVSSRHFQVWLCSGAQTRNRLVKMGSFFWKKFISMERNTWWVKNIRILVLRPGELRELSGKKLK